MEAARHGNDEQSYNQVNNVTQSKCLDGDNNPAGDDEEEQFDRGAWAGKLDFILSCVGYSVGLGNVWRFPYLCFKNGGGAFLIPYIFCVAITGIPMFFLEASLGQFLTIGGLGVWKICPIFKGVGWAAVTIAFWLNIYYIVVIAWDLLYLFSSFTKTLPWSTCDNWWNDDKCYIKTANHSNSSISTNEESSVLQFWNNRVLEKTDGIETIGTLRWELALTLLAAWALCYFCIWKGVKQTGKVVYFTALFPYCVLIILLIRGALLSGSGDGVMFYLTPNVTKLSEPGVWLDAGSQVFFSYGLALGAVIALGSYNPYKNNVYKDAIIVSCVNSSTSIFAGFVIFSIIGFMAKELGADIKDVVAGGPGLAFQAYPEAVTKMPLSQLWAILFFFMILLLGLDSQFCTMEGFITAICDEYPHLLHRHPQKEIFIAITCSVSYLIGLLCITQGGVFVFELLNFYAASGYALLYLGIFENAAVSWVFGVRNFYDGLEDMIGYRPSRYWMCCWVAITPAVLFFIFVYSLSQHTTLQYDNTYTYPWWAELVGWLIALSSMQWVPTYAAWYLYHQQGTFMERLRRGMQPTPELAIRMLTTKANLKAKRDLEAGQISLKNVEDASARNAGDTEA